MRKPHRCRRVARILLVAVASSASIAAASWRFGNDVLLAVENHRPSESGGTTADGFLVDGKRLPTSGDSFVTYSYLGSTIGRTAVHSRVRDTLIATWEMLHSSHPDTVWVYGETGWPSGGDFWPHKTHQSGLSVDLMVPVRNARGLPTTLPCRAWNGLCYELHADQDGLFPGDLQTDFEALEALLETLVRTAPSHGLAVRRVIYAPDLQLHLARTRSGARLLRTTRFSKRPSWVRHDNHVHVDFVVQRD
jgi:penicillin-insensitive murein endopeptidase